MATIEEVNLTELQEKGWTFTDRSRTLPGGRTDLTVTDGSKWWTFKCKSEGGGEYCISGSAWRSFFVQKKGAMLTLYAKEDDEDLHRI